MLSCNSRNSRNSCDSWFDQLSVGQLVGWGVGRLVGRDAPTARLRTFRGNVPTKGAAEGCRMGKGLCFRVIRVIRGLVSWLVGRLVS